MNLVIIKTVIIKLIKNNNLIIPKLWIAVGLRTAQKILLKKILKIFKGNSKIDKKHLLVLKIKLTLNLLIVIDKFIKIKIVIIIVNNIYLNIN